MKKSKQKIEGVLVVDGGGQWVQTLTFFGGGSGSKTSRSHFDVVTSEHVQPTLLYRLFQPNLPLFECVGEMIVNRNRITTNPRSRSNEKGILTQLETLESLLPR
jgi:hypothetical protein